MWSMEYGLEYGSAAFCHLVPAEVIAFYSTMRIWWFPVLCKGKLHVDCFDSDFPGEKPDGASILVERVRSAVNVRFQNVDSKPNIVFTDRGRGFYEPSNGKIQPEYRQALRDNSFTAILGDNAAEQLSKAISSPQHT